MREFKTLTARERLFVATRLRETNQLRINPQALEQRIRANTLFVHVAGDRVCCTGFKQPSEKIREAILLHPKLVGVLRPSTSRRFVHALFERRALEKGWTLNELGSGSREFGNVTRATLDAMSIEVGPLCGRAFTVIRADNHRALAHTRRTGFVPWLQLESPYTTAGLVISVYQRSRVMCALTDLASVIRRR